MLYPEAPEAEEPEPETPGPSHLTPQYTVAPTYYLRLQASQKNRNRRQTSGACSSVHRYSDHTRKCTRAGPRLGGKHSLRTPAMEGAC